MNNSMYVVCLMLICCAAVKTNAQQAAGELKTEKLDHANLAALGIEAELCRLGVPENRTKSDSRIISVAFIRLRSKTGDAGAPLVFLRGGPGQPATPILQSQDALSMFQPFLEQGDVILLDQRGTGQSKPNLTFKLTNQISTDLFASEANMKAHFLTGCRDAAKYFRGEGVDFAGYTTVQSAADINDIRVALEVEKLRLVGFSYGTHLALATMKQFGNHLDRVVVAGVEGLDHTLKLPQAMDTQFAKIAKLAAADSRMSAAGNLVELRDRVFQKLEQEPIKVSVKLPGKDGLVEMPVGKFALQFILRMDIGDASDIPVFPRLLYEIDRGETQLLAQFVQKRLPIFQSFNVMTLVMDSASGASTERRAAIEIQAKESAFGNVGNFPFYPEVIEIFEVPDLGQEFRSPLISDVPTLFLTGTLDWNSPPYQAELIRFGFNNAEHITVVNAGHEQILPQPEIFKAMIEFMAGQAVGDREVQAPPIRFVPLDDGN